MSGPFSKLSARTLLPSLFAIAFLGLGLTSAVAMKTDGHSFDAWIIQAFFNGLINGSIIAIVAMCI